MNGPALRSWPARAAAVAALAVGAGALTLAPGAAPTASAAGLVPWSDCDALLAHYRAELERTASAYGSGGGGEHAVRGGATLEAAADTAAAVPAPAAAAATSTADAVGTGPTGTNLQETGVDEPDSAKLAGGLLLTTVGGQLQVVRAAAEPEVLATLPLPEGMGGGELLVAGDRVLVVGTSWSAAPMPVEPGAGDVRLSIAPVGTQSVRLLLVDVSTPTEPAVVEELQLDGRYVSARLVGDTVRLVTTSSPQVPAVGPAEPYGPDQERAALEANRAAAGAVGLDAVLPQAVRRGADGEELDAGSAVDCADVRRAATEPVGASTLLVTTLRPTEGLAAVDRDAVTTDGDLVYASPQRLYVATSRWGTVGPAGEVAGGTPSTEVHAFDTSGSATEYVGSGSVPGWLYGRWALSEHEGDLRVATTLQPPWGGGQGGEQSSSSVVVLREQDGRLAEVGRLDGLGKDERIYAVRYFGDLATVVTFRQTDPLYVLDLADPTAPRVLGELKVPGFSTYLHPVGDDRLLAVGQDADETGRVTGFQLSTYDLTDLSRPTQVDRLSLGPGWSPASDDSRAFSYDPQRRVAVLPFQGEDTPGQTALAVRVGEDFTLSEAGRLDVPPDWPVERVVLGDGAAYAVSWAGVVAADVDDGLRRTGAAGFSGGPQVHGGSPVPGPAVVD